MKAPTVRPRRQRFLTANQLDGLADAAQSRQEGAGPLVLLLLGWSGLRWGEAVALKASCVNVERRRVRVEESATEVNGELVWGDPKSSESRTVVVPRFVIEALAPRHAAADRDGLVFTAPRGGPLRHSNWRRDVWRPAVKSAAVPDDLIPHDLRDAAASLMIASGASVMAVARALGHADPAVTLRVYAGLYDDDLETLADRLEDVREAQTGHKGNEARR